jgi:ATP-independent RNA helicase DbpA
MSAWQQRDRAGRREGIGPGDMLAALSKDLDSAGTQIGKINVNEFSTYVAVERGIAAEVLRKLASAKVKGRSVKVRTLEG